MPWVVVGEKPIPMVTVPAEMFWASRYLREVLVTALVIKARFAVTTEPKRVVSAPEGKAEMVTELPTVTVPEMANGIIESSTEFFVFCMGSPPVFEAGALYMFTTVAPSLSPVLLYCNGIPIACPSARFERLSVAVTVPEMGCVAGKLDIDTTLPLTALRTSVMACVPRLTTVWAVICCPLERMVDSVVAD